MTVSRCPLTPSLFDDPTTAPKGDLATFLKSWARNPLRVAAIAPSGRALAELMTRDIGPRTGRVIEIGPGTGAFTRAILARGVAAEDLTLVEYDPDFVRLLGLRFPEVRIIQMDAARLKAVAFDDRRTVGAVVSGLPLLSMPLRKVMSILTGALAHLEPGGAFYQFTYGPRCPVARPVLDRLGLKATHVGGTMLNIPPASVYRISRRGSHTVAAAD